MKNYSSTLVLLFLFVANFSFAQINTSLTKRTPTGKIRCLTNEYENYLRTNNPDRATTEEFQNWISPKIEELKKKRLTQKTTTIITIPVVIHIIHNGDAIGVNENISDAQALSQITVLNQDFRRMINTPGYNTNAVGADIEIEFCLAQRQPDGITPTNGINRIQRSAATYSTLAATENMKVDTQWDPNKYFNIWTVYFSDNTNAEMKGALGYAQPPSNSGLSGLTNSNNANTDGLVVDFRNFGSEDIAPGPYSGSYKKGRTATHEIGHCLGLLHIWGDGYGNEFNNNPDCSATDYCADTPQAGWEHYQCGIFDTCPLNPGRDMNENYMDYTPDECMNVFTLDQKNRILAVMNNSPRRKELKTSDACSPPLAIKDFDMLNQIQLYPNPSENVLNISIPELQALDSLLIYNAIGQLIENKDIVNSSNLSIDISNYSKGVYFIKIIKDNTSKTIRFIKK